MIRADVTGLAEIAPEDPEPEFVDVNAAGEIAVTLQENNHIVILGPDGAVRSHFSAGAVDLEGIDADRGRRARLHREPARPAARARRACSGSTTTASPPPTRATGTAARAASRSSTATARSPSSPAPPSSTPSPRSATIPRAAPTPRASSPRAWSSPASARPTILFVLAERASIVGVYRIEDGAPVLHQLLPSGVSPEGADRDPVAQPLRHRQRGRSRRGRPRPRARDDLRTAGRAGGLSRRSPRPGRRRLIGWGALSGLAADPEAPGRLFAVSDSVYGMAPTIFAIDATAAPGAHHRARSR